MSQPKIVVAGATGKLGTRIVRALRVRGAEVVTLSLRGSRSVPELAKQCDGARCVVSALAGLADVIIDAQSVLLDAAVAANVPRFIPSDYALDFTKTIPGGNRNLDQRRAFHARLDAAPIAATSILCGMFADLLVGQAPFVIKPIRRVLYFENANQPMDFTTMDDAASFTAAAALDETTPRFLRIAGDEKTAAELATIASELSGKRFGLLRGGSLKRLDRIIAIAKRVHPARGEVYPPWQGMQYMRDMYSGLGKLAPLDNDRYPGMRWTRVRDVLAPVLAKPAPVTA